MRTKLGGGVAGHNGLKSLERGLGSRDFQRVRIGVGRPDSTDPEVVSSWVLGRFAEDRESVAALIESAAVATERLIDEISNDEDGTRSEMEPLTSYETDGNGIGLLRLDRPEARNAINTAMLEGLLEHLGAARADEDLRVLVSPRPTTWGSPPAPTSARNSIARARSAGCSSSPTSTTI